MIANNNCKCGLTKANLLSGHNMTLIDPETQKCKAIYIDEKGNELMCNQLLTSHPNSTHDKVGNYLYIVF